MPDERSALLREAVMAVLLLVAVIAVAIGAAMLSPAVGWIVGGVLGGGWAIVVLGDVL